MRNRFLLRFMMLAIILTITSIQATASFAQAVKFSVNNSSISYRELFNYVESSSSYRFSYKNDEFNDQISKNVNYEGTSINELLTSALAGTDYIYKIIDKDIIITKNEPKTNVAQQKQSVKGVVLDETGKPMTGVTVIIKGTTTGDITSATGGYSIANVQPENTIEFSFFGYKKRDELVGKRTQINVTMQVESIVTEEIVVTALGIKRSEKALGYSVQKIDGGALNVVKGANVAATLTGKVAGLNVKNSSEFAESPSLQLRGESPLLVIDGVPYANISLNDIASDDIESMSVLKGATASALYGSRGGSGAILITTKKGADGAKGLTVSLNSSTMFEAGFTALPEVQTSYSSGGGGTYYTGDFVWGAKLDEGFKANQHNP
ncbi:MAG: TonB-dependent receptor plug domain-containing protein, partial [Rikenellaceae bacterium]